MKNVPAKDIKTRQVFDIPPVEIEVTEHQGEIKICPQCNKKTQAQFPEGVSDPVQYGQQVKACSLYLMNHQLIPYKRVTELFKACYNLSISPGTLFNFNREAFKQLNEFSEQIKCQLINSPVIHFDETGMRCDKTRQWLHVASTDKLTYYELHEKRGTLAMDEIGVLPEFSGYAVHDHWKPYFKYINCMHILCNAHHLRELTFIADHEDELWANAMKKHLLKIHNAVEETKGRGDKNLAPLQLKKLKAEYHEILKQGFEYHRGLSPPDSEPVLPKKRRRKKQKPGKNLLDRLRDFESAVLSFMDDFAIPFTNNLGEQDIRMNKVKEKISGCFRSAKGAEYFFRIRSYISTARKQGWDILQALNNIITGNAFIPLSLA